MANHPSSLKRHRQSEKQRLRNRSRKSEITSFEKKVRQSTTKEDALKFLKTFISKISKASQKGNIHKKNAARHVSRLAQWVNKIAS